MAKADTERRNQGRRRWGLEMEFPLKDSNGVLVISERRNLSDRRLENIPLEERLVMFSGMPPVEPE